jgi:hypothetical protein
MVLITLAVVPFLYGCKEGKKSKHQLIELVHVTGLCAEDHVRHELWRKLGDDEVRKAA